MNGETLSFNGIDARSGEYLLQLERSQLIEIAGGGTLDGEALSELRFRKKQAGSSHFGVVEGVDVCDLAQAGWGLILPAVKPDSPESREQAAILEALDPLIRHRRAQAARLDERRFRIYAGTDGARAGESKPDFLSRHDVGPGAADPDDMPYYLLIVGDPGLIDFQFQSLLSVARAVGRVHFDTLEEYATYARSVVEAESGRVALPKRAAFFGVANPDDAATDASSRELVTPLADQLSADARFADWRFERTLCEAATRAALSDLLCGGDAPALLFSASHGVGFPKDDPLQLRHQGALLCQDWPGPIDWRRKPIPEDFYLAGDHLPADLSLLGHISFLFACYGAGTPELDEFSQQAFKKQAAIAPRSFVAGLPRAMLNRPKGGALAVVGHVERAWGYSFLWEGADQRQVRQIGAFKSTLASLLRGMPLGAAMEYFDERHAELAVDLTARIEKRNNGIAVDEYKLAADWTANNDARGYAILGDPAVRLAVADPGATRSRTPLIVETAQVAAPPAQPAAPVAAPAAAAVVSGTGDQSFGFFSRDTAQPPAEPSTLQRLVTAVGATLTRALDDAASLEVSTWVADDLSSARFEGGKMVGAELRAFTRLSLDGDTVVCLPQKDGEVDREVWDIHAAMVKQAQETRAELLRSLVSVAASLAGLGK